jgi:hypothetical protein
MYQQQQQQHSNNSNNNSNNNNNILAMSASREISGNSDWERIVFGRYAGHVHFEQHDCRALKKLAKFLRQRNKEDNDAHLQRVGDIPNNLIAQLVISFDIMERADTIPTP